MPKTYDAIVLGTGGVGSAALMHLATSGLRVLGLDQFPLAHDRGSSHGESRIIRKAYFEHPDYVPLAVKACDAWAELEEAIGGSLLEHCGLFLAGPAGGDAVAGTRRAAELHNLPLENVSLDAARGRFSEFLFDAAHEVVFEQDAGLLWVEQAVRAHGERALAMGAEHRIETVTDWFAEGSTVHVTTTVGKYESASLAVCGGPWSGTLLSELGLPLTVLRKLQFWFESQAAGWTRSPAFFFEQPEGCFYGLPSRVDGCRPGTTVIKVAEHTGGQTVDDPLNVDRHIRGDDVDSTQAFVRRTLHHVDARVLRHSVCMYTMTPDGHFIVDRHPEYPQVVFAAGFSGHGFKFTPVLGEALGDLVVDGSSPLPIEFLRLNRPTLSSP